MNRAARIGPLTRRDVWLGNRRSVGYRVGLRHNIGLDRNGRRLLNWSLSRLITRTEYRSERWSPQIIQGFADSCYRNTRWTHTHLLRKDNSGAVIGRKMRDYISIPESLYSLIHLYFFCIDLSSLRLAPEKRYLPAIWEDHKHIRPRDVRGVNLPREKSGVLQFE